MIEVWRYRLQPRTELNATAPGAGSCAGALIRRDGGYGCIQPWPSLGDLPIGEQLARLALHEPTGLARRALDCCAIDGAARRERRCLFEGIAVPRSHVTAAAGETVISLRDRAEQFSAEGFHIVKLKTGPDIAAEAARVNAFCNIWLQLESQNKIRLDFNCTLKPAGFLDFAALLHRETVRAIDFVEDPFPYDAERWRTIGEQSGLHLALDRDSEQHQSCDAFQVRVWKPACSPPPGLSLQTQERLVVTSYMDHAIGQLFAAYEAAMFPGQVETCGLLTHSLFERDPFFQRLAVKDARLVPPVEPGLGFGAMLEALPWRPLT